MASPTEIAPALFAYGYDLDRRGEPEEADTIYWETVEGLENIFRSQPERLPAGGLARCAVAHGRQLFLLKRFHQARAAFRRGVDLLDSQRGSDMSRTGAELLAVSLHWLGRTQYETGEFDGALKSLRRSCGMLRGLILLAPSPEKRAEYKLLFRVAKAKRQRLEEIATS